MIGNHCTACRAFTGHACLLWEVHDDDQHGEGPGDYHILCAEDARDAAERWAEYSDRQGDYDCAGGYSEITARIRRFREGDSPRRDDPWVTFKVEGRTEAVYYAREEL